MDRPSWFVLYDCPPQLKRRFLALHDVLDAELDPPLHRADFFLMLVQGLEQQIDQSLGFFHRGLHLRAGIPGTGKIMVDNAPEPIVTMPIGIGLLERELDAIVRLSRTRRERGPAIPLAHGSIVAGKPIDLSGSRLRVKSLAPDAMTRFAVLRRMHAASARDTLTAMVDGMVVRLPGPDLLRFDRLAGDKSPGRGVAKAP